MAKRKVLLVDDESDYTKPVKEFFEKVGNYEVRVENVPANAVETSKHFKPDIILLDILMPQVNGFQLLERLKSENATALIPVVVLSALTSKEEKLKATALYGDCYIEKPVDLDMLVKKVEEVLKRSGRI